MFSNPIFTMAPPNDFITYLLDLLKPMGPVSAQRMFGGYGIYLNNLMFGLVSEEVFYLKADDQNKTLFEKEGLSKFTYQKQGKDFLYILLPSPCRRDGGQ